MSKKGTIKLSEQRKLHSKSGNRCAICKTVLVDVENIDSACIGVNAHIYGEKPGAARYDATKPIEYVNSEANLIFLCCNCHTKIDGEEKEYPPEKLFEIKKQHEREVINEQSSFPKKKIYSPIENSLSREVVPFKDFQKGKTHLYFHKELNKSLFAACVEKRRVVLLGEAGCGKSVELKKLAAEVSADEKNNLYPILYDLKLYTSQGIEEIIRSEYSGIPMDKVFLILDAYDEIEEEEQIRFARKLNSFVKKHPNTFIVISSRNNFYTTADKDGYGAKFENFEEYSLCCLSAKQIEDYVLECKASWDLFCKEVNKHHINDLIENPFYLIEIVKLLLEDGELPEKSELMEKIILSRFSKDIKKYINTKDIYACKRDIMLNLQKVAFAMQCMHKVQISEDNYQHLLSREDRNYLSYSGIFSICENETHQFEHNNFREFLTAKYVSCLELEKIKQLLLTNDGKIKESWANVLSYLVIIYDNEEFLPWLCEAGPEYIVKFERTRIGVDDRNRILIEFIDSVSSRNIWLSRTNISAEDLAEFGESDI
ncbi:MAG: NACHT domain-containing protein, partial [Acutalibacteraceae bacterium]|nr:NACHT domain-containing protein [Acutalibacteraceae bacterium]